MIYALYRGKHSTLSHVVGCVSYERSKELKKHNRLDVRHFCTCLVRDGVGLSLHVRRIRIPMARVGGVERFVKFVSRNL